jgi:CRP-like cAMP-binding protein
LLLAPRPSPIASFGPLFARESETASLADGTVVFREGDQGDRFYVIEAGSASVSIEGRPVRELAPGDFFGEIALLTDVPRTATVTATAPLTVRTIERDAFLAAVTGHGAALETGTQWPPGMPSTSDRQPPTGATLNAQRKS